MNCESDYYCNGSLKCPKDFLKSYHNPTHLAKIDSKLGGWGLIRYGERVTLISLLIAVAYSLIPLL